MRILSAFLLASAIAAVCDGRLWSGHRLAEGRRGIWPEAGGLLATSTATVFPAPTSR